MTDTSVPWYVVLQALEVPASVRKLPMRIGCPCCRRQSLHLFEDSKFGGAWHYCSSCRISGDMLGLASRVWKINPTAAIDRLLRITKLPCDTGTALTLHKNDANKQKLLQNFVSRAAERANCDEGQAGLYLFDRLNLTSGLFRETWKSRMGPFLGSSTVRELVQQLPSLIHRHPFVGKGWKELITIPCWMSPGQLSGLLTIGKQASPDDIVFFPILSAMDRQSTAGLAYRDPGLAMLDGAFQGGFSETFGRTLFVANAFEALRVQSRHLRDSTVPLPLAGFVDVSANGRYKHNYRNYDCWRHLTSRQLVFWGTQPSASLVNMAARCDGLIAIYNKPEGPSTAMQQLHGVQREAKPWIAALGGWLQTLSTQQRVKLLHSLDLPGDCIETLREQLPSKAQKAMDELLSPERRSRAWVQFGTRRIFHTQAGWVVEPGGHVICSAHIRIDTVLRRYGSAETFYQGEIQQSGATVPFTASLELIESDPIHWLQRTLAEANAPPLRYDGSWKRNLLSIAMQFSQPQLVQNAGRYGWCSLRGAFELPKFSLLSGGRVLPRKTPITDPVTPGLHILNPEETLPNLHELAAVKVENELGWAVMACLGANVLAPALNEDPCGIGLFGLGAALVGNVTAAAVGCASYSVDLSRPNAYPKLTAAMQTHDWPLQVRVGGGNRSQLAPWLNDPEPHNVVLELLPELAAALRVAGAWRFVHCDLPVADASTVRRHAGAAFFSWLRDLSIRKLQLGGEGSLALRVLHDMRAWLEGSGHSGETITRAEKWLEDCDAAKPDLLRYISRTLAQLIDTGKLQFYRAGFEEQPEGCSYHQETELGTGLFVPRAIVNKVLMQEGIPLLDPYEALNAFAAGGVLEKECVYRDYPGWLLNLAWWEKEMRQYRKSKESLLRVVG